MSAVKPSLASVFTLRGSLLTLAIVTLVSFTYLSLKSLHSPTLQSSISTSPSPLTVHLPKVVDSGCVDHAEKVAVPGNDIDQGDDGDDDSVYHLPKVFKLNYEEMVRRFKVYIYSDGDPNTYYQTPRKLTGKYASEGYFFQDLKESSFVTTDPDQADLFFIPISCHKMRGKIVCIKREVSVGEVQPSNEDCISYESLSSNNNSLWTDLYYKESKFVRSLRSYKRQGISYENMTIIVQNYVESLMIKYPYWNRTLGTDHFFVTCHDVGVRATEGLPNLVKNSIRVVCSPSYDVGFIPHKDVALPQILQPFALPSGGNDIENRTTLGFWAGHRNSKIRVILARVWENDTELDISNNRINRATGHLVYQKRFYRTKFCICPGGSQVNSARIADSIHYGCIPVILSNYYDLPFNDILNWHKFSVVLKEKDVYQLKQILKNITQEEFVTLHNNLVKCAETLPVELTSPQSGCFPYGHI
ncbi:hypothetical protein CASFOL_023132 [Castilleja foliolosa]|uniref:Exostosin GT47 domain-containing protein n=1 Tax=Castilleja foliolosa TaxID=1961234 RepID=A0ABD3CJQ0_9LAMI